MRKVVSGLASLNKWLNTNNLKIDLFIIGSYALHLQGVQIERETDIDPVNAINDEDIENEIHKISQELGYQWFDLGASSIILPDGYEDRLELKETLTNINIYTLSLKDLTILKVAAYFHRKEQGIIRDLEDLIHIDPSMTDVNQAFDFILDKHGDNLPDRFKQNLAEDLEELRDELSNYFK
jgi:hypothetical protein